MPITSIPSPFANFELVRSAFDAVTRNAEVGLTGVTIYHKLVSYALDVLEIFYNYRRFQDHYEIIEWSRNDLKHLKNNNAQGEYYLTDVPALMQERGGKIGLCRVELDEQIIGVNTPEQLETVEQFIRQR